MYYIVNYLYIYVRLLCYNFVTENSIIVILNKAYNVRRTLLYNCCNNSQILKFYVYILTYNKIYVIMKYEMVTSNISSIYLNNLYKNITPS